MKLDRRHLVAAVAVLLASIVYNVWTFSSGPKKRGDTVRPGAAAAPGGAPTTAAAVDPMTIPAPPAIDLQNAPAWDRDPFHRSTDHPAPVQVPAVAPALGPAAPVIGAILLSAERRIAVINGHVRVVGDRIDAGTIVEIIRDSIIVRNAAGAMQRYPLQDGSKDLAPKEPKQ